MSMPEPLMTERKLWKVISLSKTRGNRISRSMTYNGALTAFKQFKTELLEGDTLYMMQVLEVAAGRTQATVKTTDEIVVEAPTWLVNDTERKTGFDAVRRT